MFKVIFYESDDGKRPAEKFLSTLEVKMRAKMVGILEILQENGNQLRETYSAYLHDGIFEIRGKIGSNITRILYFFFNDGKIILTNGFIKKTNKIPKNELALAKKYRKDYLLREEKQNENS